MRRWPCIMVGLALLSVPGARATTIGSGLRVTVPAPSQPFLTRGTTIDVPVTVANDGPDAVPGVVLFTSAHEGFTAVAFGGMTCPVVAPLTYPECALGAIPAGQTRTVTVTLRADAYSRTPGATFLIQDDVRSADGPRVAAEFGAGLQITDGTTILPLLEPVSQAPDGAWNRARYVVRVTNVGDTAFPAARVHGDFRILMVGGDQLLAVDGATVEGTPCALLADPAQVECDVTGLAPGASRVITVRGEILDPQFNAYVGGTFRVATDAGVPVPNPYGITAAQALTVGWTGPGTAPVTVNARVTAPPGRADRTVHVTVRGGAVGHTTVLYISRFPDGGTVTDPSSADCHAWDSGHWFGHGVECVITPTAADSTWTATVHASGAAPVRTQVLTPWWTPGPGSVTDVTTPVTSVDPIGTITPASDAPVMHGAAAAVPVAVRCADPCRVAASLWLRGDMARRLGLPPRVGTVVRTLPSGAATLRVALRPAARRAIASRGGRLPLTLRVVLTGEGTPLRVERRVVLRPR